MKPFFFVLLLGSSFAEAKTITGPMVIVDAFPHCDATYVPALIQEATQATLIQASKDCAQEDGARAVVKDVDVLFVRGSDCKNSWIPTLASKVKLTYNCERD